LPLLDTTFEPETPESQSNTPKTHVIALLLIKTRFKKLAPGVGDQDLMTSSKCS